MFPENRNNLTCGRMENLIRNNFKGHWTIFQNGLFEFG